MRHPLIPGRSLSWTSLRLIQGWGYAVATLDNFLLKLFDKYAELLKKRFSEDFQEVSAFRSPQKLYCCSHVHR